MSDTTCKSDSCTCLDKYAYSSQNATDAGGAGSVVSTDAGSTNPNCPSGYVWGGLGCVKSDGDDTECSTGYLWSGAECLANDDDFECAEGYRDVDGECVECPALDTPTVVEVGGVVRVTCANPFGFGALLHMSYSVNGADEVTLTEVAIGGGSYLFQILTFSLNAGDELCAYFRAEPLVEGEWTECSTVYSKAKCILIHK